MSNDSNEAYKYSEIPFQPTILAELSIKLFSGRIVEAKTIYDETLSFHLTNGGSKPLAKNARGTTSKGLSLLRNKGLADCPSAGYWKINESLDSINSEQIINAVVDIIPVSTNDLATEKTKIADTEIGVGKGAVYLYYLPLYRQIAEQRNERFWQCKIGRTDGDPLQRILNQAATALPEKPHVAVVLKTNMSLALESTIHNILTLRGRKIDESPGAEWYLTSPNEILTIYKFITQEQLVD